MLSPGDVVLGRFEVERLAGTGGMGVVWRARDRNDGTTVALKELQHVETGLARFDREARVIASLSHPGIVRYVAHGADEHGHPYLAMEWLDGEDLAARLASRPLTIGESLLVLAQVADAVGHAHARGIVHRDLKPENLFLQDRDLGRVKVVDFGIARAPWETMARTATGAFVGTPMYAAPEQARGDRSAGPPADVFALGCVLFECLTGAPAFSAQNVLAALAKVVIDEPPRVRSLRPDVPDTIDDLVARTLAKDPAARPADGAAAARELRAAAAELASGGVAAARAAPRPALTAAEQRVVSVLLVRHRRSREGAADPDLDATVELQADESFVREVIAVVNARGAGASRLADGSILVSVTGGGNASDDAARAARLALAVYALRSDVGVALATGRGDSTTLEPVGEAIDRAAALLRASPAAGILVDPVTAGLLDARFRLEGTSAALVLREERTTDHGPRTLLGRPVPCVGREREIAELVALFDDCIEENRARPVLITAPPGVGKSRLQRELVRALSTRQPAPRILLARGDPMSAGSPFGMLADLVRRSAGLVAGEPADAAERRIRALVDRVVSDPDDARRAAEFLAELSGVPLDAASSVQLAAARADPILMGDQIRRAFEDWLLAEARAQPVLLVMEDMHWGDLPSVRAIDGALRHLRDAPFMVLGLARPEVRVAFPDLWAGRALVHVELSELSRRAAERLVRIVLGARAERDAALVERLVVLAAGNAFFLEELVRAVADGRDGALPDTVVAMVQSRLEALDPESRRVLRAASVFGRVVWTGAVQALLGGVERNGAVPAVLDRLVEGELLTRRERSRFAHEREHTFRHALVQEGAYAMLTHEDRALGHRLAAAWLEHAGETDAAVVAEHYERGGAPDSALVWYRRAVAQALEGNDFASVQARVERALALGATGELRGELRLRLAEAHKWRGDNESMAREAARASLDLAPGSDLWCNAIADACSANARLGRHGEVAPLTLQLASRVREAGRATRALLVASLRVAETLFVAGQTVLATMLLASAEEGVASFEHEPTVRARLLTARARAQIADGRVADVELYEAAAREHERAGDVRNAQLLAVSAAWARRELGMYAEAERGYRAALTGAERMGTTSVAAAARGSLGTVLARLGLPAEALAFLREAVAEHAAHGNRRLEGSARVSLALLRVEMGDGEAAEVDARAAVSLLEGLPSQSFAQAGLAHVLLARGRAQDACDEARGAAAHLARVGFVAQGESLVRLTLPECLFAVGESDAAREALRDAKERLLARAAKIADDAQRRSFLERVPENARTIALAIAHAGDC